MSRQDAGRWNKKLRILIRIIQRSMSMYARVCHEDTKPEAHELAMFLERGVPREMIPLVRSTQFHIEGMSLDFQSGKLVEINAAPLPPFVASNALVALGVDGPGVLTTTELVTERVRILAERHKRGGRTGKILLVNQIGQLEIGTTGWFVPVGDYLSSQGYEVAIGSVEDHSDADVIWANLTWMTCERWGSVLTEKVMNGEAQIYPSPRNFLASSKWFLTLLGSPIGRRVLGISRAEEQLLDELVPWTGDLEDSRNTIRFLLEGGAKLYGKPYLSSGGRGGGSIRDMRSLEKIGRPAVVQAWTNPYELEADWYHDLRFVLWGAEGQFRTWLARVWRDSQTLMKPMDSPIVYK